MSEENEKICPICEQSIPADAPEGLCPRCVLVQVAETEKITQGTSFRMEPPSVESVAEAFPQFQILSLIGRGGMGAVYHARQPKLDRDIALKILPPSLGKLPDFSERFTREARMLAKLSHPNIVAIYDFGQSGDFFFLVMEYVDGVNMRQAMRAGEFTPEQALEIAPKICSALQIAHEEGILHRDIKPENILIDTKGRVKIADFGIAKLMGEEGVQDFTLTGTYTPGTPAYMAPEQIETPSNVDHRADIYSLGVVIYEMLTGELPLGRFPPPSEKSAVHSQVDEIVFRALEKERELRQQTAEQVKTEIETVGIARQPDPGYRKRGSAKSKRQVSVWLALISVALVIWGLLACLLMVVHQADTRGGHEGVLRSIARQLRDKATEKYDSALLSWDEAEARLGISGNNSMDSDSAAYRLREAKKKMGTVFKLDRQRTLSEDRQWFGGYNDPHEEPLFMVLAVFGTGAFLSALLFVSRQRLAGDRFDRYTFLAMICVIGVPITASILYLLAAFGENVALLAGILTTAILSWIAWQWWKAPVHVR